MRSRAEFDAAMRLAAEGHEDAQVSARTGIPRRTISGWRRGTEGQLHTRRQASGCGMTHDFSRLPADSYAYLLGLFLGDGCISAAPRGVWHLRIALDAAYPMIIAEGLAALQEIFPANRASAQRRKRARCVDLSLWSKHLPCLFPQHGPGRKHERDVSLRPWQETLVASHRESLVRGLIHSDGNRCVAVERRGAYERRAARYSFSNRSEDIKAILCESLDALGVRWTRPSDREIAIYRKESVARLDQFVGPKR